MLRIALVLALLVAIGGLAVSQFVAKPKVDELKDNLDTTTQTLQETTAARNAAETEARNQKALAEKVSRELTDTRDALEVAATDAQQQRGRAERLQTDLTRITVERNEAQQALAAWNVLGIEPGQVAQIRAELRAVSEERDTYASQEKIFLRNIELLQNRLSRYEGDREKPVEMPGLKGSVVAVDPDWDFVILDVGEEQGAKERGVVMVRRGDKLIGKARIVTVEPSRSVANLLPGWKQGDLAIEVGDAVLY
ncbi:MAG: hypothetical protein KF791_17820 [Verrucomicrobiae bacterium]|nr:hypothetical protein [Verrucomicrobiae bacterium]